jgi:A/G-specific adenine glycosylase
MKFSNLLIQWYLQINVICLGVIPYPIWLSEIMLQQTRVAQGMPYFLSLQALPVCFEANEEEQVLKLWQGLGYYSRARNLHKTAQYIALISGLL